MNPTVSARRIFVVLFDMLAVLGAYYLAFLLRFDFHIDPEAFPFMLQSMPMVLIIYIASCYSFALYRGIYYFSSFSDLLNIAKSMAVGAVAAGAFVLFMRFRVFPRSVLILHPMLTFLFIGGIRFGIRLTKSYMNAPANGLAPRRRVLLIGAGELGESILRQMLKTPEANYKVVGFLDDDRAKWDMRIHGYTVFGGRDSLTSVLDKFDVDEIVVTMEAKRGELVRSIVEGLRDREVKPEIKIAPSLEEMLKTPSSDVGLRKVRPADLLNRDVIRLDLAKITKVLGRKTVLISGAGGTIGSELCRQALQYAPEAIILFENHATSLFYSEADLRERTRGTRIIPVLGDIRDVALLKKVFSEHRPQVVLHAAAHKHVYQLETNAAEAVANNVLGTYRIAQAAYDHNAETFLLVSTDKAVRPASVMGATKRIAELIIRHFGRKGKTRFVAVRFGNVLGSSGSVLEIFLAQIAKGGPITVTDEGVTRYFMTVEESVQLILQAAALARGGEVFLLKMGTPVKIIDMAKNLILLSGLEPGRQIEIKVTGLKPGEKMHEELAEDPKLVDASEHPDLLVLKLDERDLVGLEPGVAALEELSRVGSTAAIVSKIQELVPTFRQDPDRLVKRLA